MFRPVRHWLDDVVVLGLDMVVGRTLRRRIECDSRPVHQDASVDRQPVDNERVFGCQNQIGMRLAIAERTRRDTDGARTFTSKQVEPCLPPHPFDRDVAAVSRRDQISDPKLLYGHLT